MEVVGNNYLPGDQHLVDKIVYELKAQGIFDQFRKECFADVDTKPAYQNLRQRVEGSVSGFLRDQSWRPDMNKNQVREMLRKTITELGYLETGVERIVDQVVNPKINTVFLPKVEEVVYRYLGIKKPTRGEKNDQMDLLPTDLEAVSPESETTEKKDDKSLDNIQDVDENKTEEDESPPFEPLEEQSVYVPHEENSVDSHLSGFSGLISHESNQSNENKVTQIEQDSQMSRNSSDSRLSIVTSDENSKMDLCEDSQSKSIKSNDSNNKSENNDKNKHKTSDRHKSRSESKSDKDRKSSKDSKSKHSSSSKDKEKDKSRDRRDSKSSTNSSRNDKPKDKSDKDKDKNDKDKEKSDKDKEKSDRDKEKSDKDKEKSDKDKEKSDKDHGKSSSSSGKHSSSSSSKDKSSRKDSSKSDKDKSDKDKNRSSSHKDSKSRDSKSKDKSSSHKHSSSSSLHNDKHKKDKDKDKDKKKDKPKDDHYSSKDKKNDRRSTDRDSNDGQTSKQNYPSTSHESNNTTQNQKTSQDSNSGAGDSGNTEHTETTTKAPVIITGSVENNEVSITSPDLTQRVKVLKPKCASNIQEALRLMKIRKQLAKLEKQNQLSLTSVNVNSSILLSASIDLDNLKENGIQDEEMKEEIKIEDMEVVPVPLQNTVISKDNWDAMEAKLREEVCSEFKEYDEDNSYEGIDGKPKPKEKVEEKKFDEDCKYFEKVDLKDIEFLKFVQEFIEKVENLKSLQKVKVLKRKVDDTDLKNNNKKLKSAPEHKKKLTKIYKINNTTAVLNEKFSLPLSPAESDKSIGKKDETILVPLKPKRNTLSKVNNQRYSSDDLYKPRPTFTTNSRRRGAKNLDN